MANGFYQSGRQALLTGGLVWGTDDVRMILIDTADYTVDLVNHDNLDDIPVAARVKVTALAGETASAGVADATDTTNTAVTGDSVEAIVLYKHTGTESTSTLIAYIDTATGLPVTPNGGDIVVQWDNGAAKVFRLVNA
jgi:hypothetical protein